MDDYSCFLHFRQGNCLLGQSNGCSGFHSDPEGDGHAVGYAAQNTTCVVGFGGNLATVTGVLAHCNAAVDAGNVLTVKYLCKVGQ